MLIDCPECGQNVSDQAGPAPNAGTQSPPQLQSLERRTHNGVVDHQCFAASRS
jgi:hypothetical protein